MKFNLIISCCILLSNHLAEASVSSLEEKCIEFANSDLTNDTQPTQQSIDDTKISFVESTEDFGANLLSGGITSDSCLRNYRGAIRGVGNRCLDVRHSNTANQTPLILFNCNNGANQRFLTLSNDNTIRVFGKCLDAGIGSNNGAFVRIHDCHGGIHQQWIITPAGQIVNVIGDNCLHAMTSANEAAIRVYSCDINSTHQRWNLLNN